MKKLATINKLSLKFYARNREILLFVFWGAALFCLMPSLSFAEGVNYLAGLKSDVSKTFGADSDLPYYLYIGEAIIAAYGYSKTKNIMLLGGLPVLMLFTHWALK